MANSYLSAFSSRFPPGMQPAGPEQVLQGFFRRVSSDPEIGPLHIALFCGLLSRAVSGGKFPLRLFSAQGMQEARISSRTTYCRLMSDLHRKGCLFYQPSMHPGSPSRIWLNIPGVKSCTHKQSDYGLKTPDNDKDYNTDRP